MKRPTGFRLSQEAIDLLRALAAHNGLSQAALIEMLLRKEAREQEIKL